MIRDLDCSSVSVLFINYVCVSLRSCQSLTSKMVWFKNYYQFKITLLSRMPFHFYINYLKFALLY